MRRGPRRLTTILWILLALFVIAGVGSLGAYLVLGRRSPHGSGTGPMPTWVAPESVEPRLALLVLAGWPDGAVIDRSLVEGDPETALCVLAHSVSLSDRARGGALLRVAAAYAGRKDAGMAQALYHKAETLAVLSPDLGDWSRAELLFEAGLGLLDLGERKEALALFEQAKLATQSSVAMKPAQRQQMAARLTRALQRAGARDIKPNISSEAPVGEDGGFAPSVSTVSLGAAVVGQGSGAKPAEALTAALPAGLLRAQEQRRQKAEALVTVLELQAGPPKPTLVADLANALAAEEAAMASLAQCQECPALLKAEVELQWAMLKWQVGKQHFGMSLVTSWETPEAGLDAPLDAAWEALYAQRRALAEREIAGGELDFSVWRGRVLVGALGLAPQFDMAAGYGQLRDLADEDPQDWIIQMNGAGDAAQFVFQAR